MAEESSRQLERARREAIAAKGENRFMLRFFLLLFGLLAALSAFAQPGTPRIALVIGNQAYEGGWELSNSANDARDMAVALREAGFEVELQTNVTGDQLKLAVRTFEDRLRQRRGVGLFYFSGHGMQDGRGKNLLLPIGRAYQRTRDAELFGVNVDSVLDAMQRADNRLNIIILDACRNAPLPYDGAKSVSSEGLAPMKAFSGSLIAFATASGRTASDNKGERNSLYTKHLLQAIRTPGMRLEDVFKKVGRDVEDEVRKRGLKLQSPEESLKLRDPDPFYFISPVTSPQGGDKLARGSDAAMLLESKLVPSADSMSSDSSLETRNRSTTLQGVSGFDSGSELPRVSADEAKRVAALFSIPGAVDTIYVFYQQMNGSKLGESTGEDAMGTEEFLQNAAAVLSKARGLGGKLVITARTRSDDWTIVNSITYRGARLSTHRYLNFGLKRVFDGKEIPLE